MERHCLSCTHCSIGFGTSDWSEVTPGEPAEFGCGAGIWSFGQDSGKDKSSLRSVFEASKNCDRFRPDGDCVLVFADGKRKNIAKCGVDTYLLVESPFPEASVRDRGHAQYMLLSYFVRDGQSSIFHEVDPVPPEIVRKWELDQSR